MHLDSASAWCWLFVCTGTVALILVIVHLIYLLGTKQKVSLFYCWLGALAVWGGALAFLLPIALNSGFGKDQDGSGLRQALLYATGGVLAVITLGETHRKNSQEKEKNENDHIRQVHAERRSRYAKAIEQLGDEKAPIRLGGVYTLVGLVDEWLTDKSIREVDDRSKEGQVIVNSLCSYLRSLPSQTKLSDLKNGKYPSDEAEVRIAIVKEISSRISFNSKSQWSDFKYDLSNIFFFYPVNFSKCIFKYSALFNDSYFAEGASFEEVNFNDITNFSRATFRKKADFSKCLFKYTVAQAIDNALNDQDYSFITNDFSEVVFTEGAKANFSHGKVYGDIIFREAEFKEGIYLSNNTFSGYTSFIGATFEKSTDFYAIFVSSAPEFFTKDNNGNEHKAKFSIEAEINKYEMVTNPDGKSFALEDHTLLPQNWTFTIPKDCRLFNPKNPSRQLNVKTTPHP